MSRVLKCFEAQERTETRRPKKVLPRLLWAGWPKMKLPSSQIIFSSHKSRLVKSFMRKSPKKPYSCRNRGVRSLARKTGCFLRILTRRRVSRHWPRLCPLPRPQTRPNARRVSRRADASRARCQAAPAPEFSALSATANMAEIGGLVSSRR